MTGPSDFLTTSRSCDMEPPIGCDPSFLAGAASFAACWARASGVQVAPVITAAAPMQALRIRKVRGAGSGGGGGPGGGGGATPLIVREVAALMIVLLFAVLYAG